MSSVAVFTNALTHTNPRSFGLTRRDVDDVYDQDGIYRAVIDRDPDAAVIVPPCSTAIPSQTANTQSTQRDSYLTGIAKKGRMAWQKASGYNKRSQVKISIGRCKQAVGNSCNRAAHGVFTRVKAVREFFGQP